ncbi:hypothetical protein C0995_015129 [Termitomyces sp. Mi166|nr:hypothetical protein C0995_015129 [Termitomyces sp. Mi166\
MSGLNAEEPESPAAIDTQQLQHTDLLGQPIAPPPPPPPAPEAARKQPASPATPARLDAASIFPARFVPSPAAAPPSHPISPHQSCIKRGLASTCAYPDPDVDHHTPGMPHAASSVQSFAPPPMYATLQNTTLTHQQYYSDYNGTYTGASTSTFRPSKRPRNLTEEETAAIRNFTRGDFFIGNNAPVRIDTRLPVSEQSPKNTSTILSKIHFASPIPRSPSGEMDNDMLRLYQIVHELSEQLAHNQKFTASLQAHAASLKAEAAHAISGFALRRFNTDLTKETFESELERMSAKTVIENQILHHENKQLSQLLREYETTMETIMSKFRNHALAAQRHELTLTRHYETLLQARETQSMSSDLLSSTEMAHVLRRLSHHLRGLLRSMAGEPPDPSDLIYDGSMDLEYEPDTSVEIAELERLLDSLDDKGATENDWAIEREIEIARLEKENAELRKLLHIDQASLDASGVVVDPIRDDPSQFVRIIPKRVRDSGDPRLRPGFWDDPPPPPPSPWSSSLAAPLQLPGPQDLPIAQGYLQGPSAGPGAGAALQRALDLQPGMRMGTRGQGRRSGIIGRGARKGGLGGLGGVSMGDGWQPPPPGPWQGPGGPAMDLMR